MNENENRKLILTALQQFSDYATKFQIARYTELNVKSVASEMEIFENQGLVDNDNGKWILTNHVSPEMEKLLLAETKVDKKIKSQPEIKVEKKIDKRPKKLVKPKEEKPVKLTSENIKTNWIPSSQVDPISDVLDNYTEVPKSNFSNVDSKLLILNRIKYVFNEVDMDKDTTNILNQIISDYSKESINE